MNSPIRVPKVILLSILAAGVALSGCKTNETKSDESAPKAEAAPQRAAPATPAPAPAVAQAPSASGTYNLSKNKPVADSSKVQSGEGTLVKGINDWEGEITGVAAAGSKFAKLKIGMSREEVFSMIGYPTYQGAYATGKAWIPFYHGSDRVRWEAVYNGQGRLIFSQQAGWGGSSSFHLTWIIHSANEGR
jgi:outer membrane protein assembly factor BamE (lipoprotein component of BamABCDE complex)